MRQHGSAEKQRVASDHPKGLGATLTFALEHVRRGGKCLSVCPLHGYSEWDPRRLVRLVLLGMEQEVIDSDFIFQCTGCERCSLVCPMGVKINNLVTRARSMRPRDQVPGGSQQTADLHRTKGNNMQIPTDVEPLLPEIEDVDVLVSLACGAGVQHVAEAAAGLKRPVQVVPGINTTFLGAALEQGVWAERCQGCGDCVLEITGGICPIARCSKSLLNGPCGGSSEGKCEIDPEVDCGWQLIYDRLSALGKLENLNRVLPSRDWSTSRDAGPPKRVVEKLSI